MKPSYLVQASDDNRFFVSWVTNPNSNEYAYVKQSMYGGIRFTVYLDVESYQSKVYELVSFNLALFTMLRLKSMSGVWDRTTKIFDMFSGEPVSRN